MEETVDLAVLSSRPRLEVIFDSKHQVEVAFALTDAQVEASLKFRVVDPFIIVNEGEDNSLINIDSKEEIDLAFYTQERQELSTWRNIKTGSYVRELGNSFILITAAGSLPYGGFTLLS